MQELFWDSLLTVDRNTRVESRRLCNSSKVNITSKTGAREAADTFAYVINVYIVIPICVFGIIGNSLSITVLLNELKRYARKNTSLILLMALSVSDLLLLFIAPFYFSFGSMAYYATWSTMAFRDAYILSSSYTFTIVVIIQTISIWVLVLVAVNRYVAVCRPLHASRLSTIRIVRVALILTVFLAVGFNVVRFFEYKTFTFYSTTLCVRKVGRSLNILSSRVYLLAYRATTHNIFKVIIPMVMLGVLNTRLIIETKRSTTLRRSIQIHNYDKTIPKQKDVLSARIIALIVVFYVCQIGSVVMAILDAIDKFNPEFKLTKNYTYRYCVTVSNMLILLNSATNFITYCFTCQHFRKTLMAIFRGNSNVGKTKVYANQSCYNNGVHPGTRRRKLAIIDNNMPDVQFNINKSNYSNVTFQDDNETDNNQRLDDKSTTTALASSGCEVEKQTTLSNTTSNSTKETDDDNNFDKTDTIEEDWSLTAALRKANAKCRRTSLAELDINHFIIDPRYANNQIPHINSNQTMGVQLKRISKVSPDGKNSVLYEEQTPRTSFMINSVEQSFMFLNDHKTSFDLQAERVIPADGESYHDIISEKSLNINVLVSSIDKMKHTWL
ncbi:unnamed protein product [Owenia fusiformis]|uniref:Uncharacterized protein n=1 Tax=Owenia fusiformis TaxID=6347 RepID=A0A8J1U2Z5_OWEFU|nr:unnamed protein product [Owenia fusiformis]